MGSREKELAIILRSKSDGSGFSEFKGDLQSAENAAKSAAESSSRSWQDSMTKIRNVSAIAFAAVGASIGFVVNEAMGAEDSLNKSRSAVKIAGQDWDKYADKLVNVSAHLQEVTRFTDDEFQQAFARVENITGDAGKSLENLGLIADVATARTIDLATASDAVGKAMQGNIGRLGVLFPEMEDMIKALGDNATHAEKAAVAIDYLGGKFKGLAEEDAKTASGQLEILKHQFGEVSESIGAAFLPVVKDIATYLLPVIKNIGEWAKEHTDLVKAIGLGALGISGFLVIATSIGLVLPNVVTGIKAMEAALTLLNKNPVYLAIGAAALATYGFITYLGDAATASGKVRAELEALSKELGVSVESLQAIRNQLYHAAKGIDGDFIPMWDDAVAAMRAGKTPLADTDEGVKKIGGSAKKAAEDIQLNIDAIRELMNAGLEFEDAKALSRGPVASTVEITASKPLFSFEEEIAWRMEAYENYQSWMDEEKKIEDEKEKERYNRKREEFNQHTQFLQAGYSTMIGTFTNLEMTGKQRREAIMNSLRSAFIRQVGQEVQAKLFGELAKRHAIAVTGTVEQASFSKSLAMSIAHGAKEIGLALQTAAARIYAFYASLGPFGIPAAVGTIAGIYAAVRGLHFQHGGIVPGSGFGDRVPAMLEPGEGVVKRSAVQSNPGAVEALNSGRNIGGMVQQNISIALDGEGLSLQRKLEIRDLVEDILPRLLERMVAERRFSASFVMP